MKVFRVTGYHDYRVPYQAVLRLEAESADDVTEEMVEEAFCDGAAYVVYDGAGGEDWDMADEIESNLYSVEEVEGSD